MTLQEEIKRAIGAHGMWKVRLNQAIEKGASEFAPAKVRVDNQCDFGKWLYGVSDPSVQGSDDYRKCLELHRKFHEVAAHALDLATRGKKDEAQAMLSLQGSFGSASAELTRAMMKWSQNAN